MNHNKALLTCSIKRVGVRRKENKEVREGEKEPGKKSEVKGMGRTEAVAVFLVCLCVCVF